MTVGTKNYAILSNILVMWVSLSSEIIILQKPDCVGIENVDEL